jgi:hypothetical protein
MTVTGGAEAAPTRVTLRTADLASHPLVLAYAAKTWQLAAPQGWRTTGAESAPLLSGSWNAAADETQTITFTHEGPGVEKPFLVTRELYSRRYPEYRALDDPRNRHVIAISTGTLPRWAFDQEIELTRQGTRRLPGSDASAGYALALSHMVESDNALLLLRKHFKTNAYFTRPRIIIASTYYGRNPGESTYRAIDLRSNVVHVEGDESARAAFGDDLVSVLLYGSAAEGALRATSDVNVILVLSSFVPAKADRLAAQLRHDAH